MAKLYLRPAVSWSLLAGNPSPPPAAMPCKWTRAPRAPPPNPEGCLKRAKQRANGVRLRATPTDSRRQSPQVDAPSGDVRDVEIRKKYGLHPEGQGFESPSSTGQRPNAILKARSRAKPRAKSAYYPPYDGDRAPWARRRFGLPGRCERHLGGRDLARLAPGMVSRIRRKVTGRTKTRSRRSWKKLQAEVDAGPKTSASYMVAGLLSARRGCQRGGDVSGEGVRVPA